jgi:fluoride exporter
VTVLYVVVGGAAGVLARYALGTTVTTHTLPWLTVAINVAGSFLLGCLVTAGDRFSPELRTGLAVGLLGGFTTFSTFSVEIFVDLESGNGAKAMGYFLASVILGVGAAAAGYYTGRALGR